MGTKRPNYRKYLILFNFWKPPFPARPTPRMHNTSPNSTHVNRRSPAPAARATAVALGVALAMLIAQAAIAATPAATLSPQLRAKVPADFVETLEQQTGAQDLIVLFEDAPIRAAALKRRVAKALRHDDDEILAEKKRGYDVVKARAFDQMQAGGVQVVRDYSHLPMAFMRVPNRRALERLLSHADVVRVYENRRAVPTLAQSLLLINEPAAAAAGKLGTGTTVAVIDTGVDYTRPDFGDCSGGPGSPSCRVSHFQNFAGNDGALDANFLLHGTNVAAIAAGVAPGAKIAALDVSTGNSLSGSAITAAINWVVANALAHNIVAMNMSFVTINANGTAIKYTAACPSSVFTEYFSRARDVGVMPVAGSGNDGYTDGIGEPACVPTAMSVGAVYDADFGALGQGICMDPSTGPDKVVCFSNSASFLTILAPGSSIFAGGVELQGTSMATPHVAGAVALLRAPGAFPLDTLDQTRDRLTSTGVPVTDARNGIVKPRLNLLGAAGVVTIAVTTSRNSSVVNIGSPVTLKATVSGNVAGHAPSGQVAFYDGTTLLGTATIVNGVAILSLPSLSAGVHAITTSYTGDTFNSTRTSGVFAVNVFSVPAVIAVINQLVLDD